MISVIVPVYNVKPYLLRCLDSLEKQTEKDLEFIIVNDGSTDGSDVVCEIFIQGKARFQYYSKPNGGLMSAWMEGLKYAKGEYVGFVDSDDFVQPNMFEKLAQKARLYDADMVMCKFAYDHIEEGRLRSRSEQNNAIVEGLYESEALSKIKTKMFPRTGQNYISPSRCNKIIRREVLEKNLKYCDKFIASGEDVNIILPCFLATKKFYYVDEALYHYVQNGASISHKFNVTLKEQYERLLSKLEMAILDYGVAVSNYEWSKVVNSYGIMLLRMILNAHLSRKETQKQIIALCSCETFVGAAKKTDKDNCNKWEKAYLRAMSKKSAIRFRWLLILSKIKNKK